MGSGPGINMTESSRTRIAKNTIVLYLRQILILFVSLYTVRVVLSTLGVEDYGIYNAVGGVVALLSFLCNTMASATQRFFSFALGQGDAERLKRTFSVNLVVYGVTALVSILALETVGLWFVHAHLNVPAERFDAVLWVYHFSIVTFFLTIMTTPFMAIIIAHEDMHIYAYLSIIEVVLKLVVVFLLVNIPFDKMAIYGFLLFAVASVNTAAFAVVCCQRYQECQFRKLYWDNTLLREISGFTGWTLFGQFTTMSRNQAVTILLNQMFNPAVVAARAIATNITTRINVFSINFNVGLYPPIIKSYAAEKMDEMFSLLFGGSKITFFLMWVFALPMFLEMDDILHVWLKNPPELAVLFTRLALIEVLINSMSLPVTTAARAPGKMMVYELSLGTLQMVIFVMAWIAFRCGFPASSVYWIAIAVNIVMFGVRLVIVKVLIGLSITEFLKKVFVPVALMAIFSLVPSVFISFYLPNGFLYVVLSVILSVIFSSCSMYYFGLDRIWRLKVRELFVQKVRKIIR